MLYLFLIQSYKEVTLILIHFPVIHSFNRYLGMYLSFKYSARLRDTILVNSIALLPSSPTYIMYVEVGVIADTDEPITSIQCNA